MLSAKELLEAFRSAAIEKGDYVRTDRDHALYRCMRDAFQELQALGAPGEAAFRSLLNDGSAYVRSWVAAALLCQGDEEARTVLETIAAEPGLLGFSASVTLKEYHAGRLRSPFA